MEIMVASWRAMRPVLVANFFRLTHFVPPIGEEAAIRVPPTAASTEGPRDPLPVDAKPLPGPSTELQPIGCTLDSANIVREQQESSNEEGKEEMEEEPDDVVKSQTLTGSEKEGESLPEGWNQNRYKLRYVHNKQLFILHGIISQGAIIFNLLRTSDKAITIVHFQPEEMVTSLEGESIEEIVPKYRAVIDTVSNTLIAPQVSLNRQEISTQTSRTSPPIVHVEPISESRLAWNNGSSPRDEHSRSRPRRTLKDFEAWQSERRLAWPGMRKSESPYWNVLQSATFFHGLSRTIPSPLLLSFSTELGIYYAFGTDITTIGPMNLIYPERLIREPERHPLRIGQDDLNPFGRAGGGMIFDPFNPRGRGGIPNPGVWIPGGVPSWGIFRGSIPPGARFDPFGPPGSTPNPGRFGRGPPDADHLPPPGYDDMFM
uniref:Proteasome inhibitor PI31 subunit n=1 Tax=Timema poppense TaxID=170557 RepID=A0A7R9H9E2_TIMPO|nr:unnamed protein product [Timema poppensis]